jgi:TPR repeat protein
MLTCSSTAKVVWRLTRKLLVRLCQPKIVFRWYSQYAHLSFIVEIWRKDTALGDVDAMFNLATYLTMDVSMINLEEAASLWPRCLPDLHRRADDENEVRALYRLGTYYRTGSGLQKKDLPRACNYLRRAADQGTHQLNSLHLLYPLHRLKRVIPIYIIYK